MEGRGDARGWTETPGSATQAPPMLAAAQPCTLEAGASDETARMVDAFNAAARPKSMLEQHREQRGQKGGAQPSPALPAQTPLYFTSGAADGKRTFL
jgi:hypothetical protein